MQKHVASSLSESAAISAENSPRPPSTKCTERENQLFLLALTGLSALALLAIWLPRFPAMQDYPQHLFMAYVIATFDDPSMPWKAFFDVDLGIEPYSLFYWVVSQLARFTNIEEAGKIFISATLLLTALYVFVSNRSRVNPQAEWPALLLIPLFFNQFYYLGFVNFLISIPVLLLLLDQQQKLLRHFSYKTLALCSLLLFLLFLAHPYSLLVYIILSTAVNFISGKGKSKWQGMAGTAVSVLIFVTWYGREFAATPQLFTADAGLRWWSPGQTLHFTLLPFAGFQESVTKEWFTTTLWCGVGGLLALASIRKSAAGKFCTKTLVLFALCMLGLSFMPYWLGDYSYFNLRMAVFCYFLLVMTFRGISLSTTGISVLVILTSALMVQIIHRNLDISAERESFLPLLQEVENGENLYPVYYQAHSEALSGKYLYQFHAHTHFYQQLLKGHGMPPELFKSAMNPVNFKHDAPPSYLQRPDLYRYVLFFGPAPVRPDFHEMYRPFAESGKWRLFERIDGLGLQHSSPEN